ncbi:MAG: respiratory nitrate reductase subunit gamma [Actinobacteria bacterium]|nr:respiratory nitrate reductase subunit gamma [Actinomycetota bacterium]
MNWNLLLFVIFPYVATAVAVIGTFYRAVRRPFTMSSLSSQLLERKKLFWGSVSFHWGVVVILTAHLVALVVPETFLVWNRAPVRLYLLEATGFALGVWALGGLLVLGYRRLTEHRVRAVTSLMDGIVLTLVGFQVLTGVLTAVLYRFGSVWGLGVMVPYVRSLLSLQPRADLLASMPFITQTHVVLFFVFLALFPFSRLVHIITVPLGYLIRPWQIVVWVRREVPRLSGISWGSAWLRGVLIVVVFAVGTVWLPSALLESSALSGAPRLVQDLAASGTWLVLLAFVIFGLRWAQRTARI